MNAKAGEEQHHFCDRLKKCLHANGQSLSATSFAAQFNLRAKGAAVTVHGARKWLMGEAIPTQARIHVLADWLGVSAAWLRFGEAHSSAADNQALDKCELQPGELAHLVRLRLLSPANRSLLATILDAMVAGEIGRAGTLPASQLDP